MKFLPAQNRHVLSELLAEALRAGFGIQATDMEGKYDCH